MVHKSLSVLLGLLLTVSVLAGCAKNSSGNSEPADRDALLERSRIYAEEMAGGNFRNTVRAFDDTMTASLTEEQLRQAWSDTVQNIGAYKSIYSAEYTELARGFQVLVILEYEKSGLKVLLNYNASEQISGLWINYIDLPNPSGTASSEISIKIGADPYMLDGILRLPEGVTAPPVVILVQGSGQSDYNETVGANKPFSDIAEALAQQGIASIRYNKRYYQYPSAAPAEITVADEITDDVCHAVEFAKAQVSLSGSKIYILGHSQGGMLAPYLASLNPDVSGIIILAGSPRGLEDIILDQNAAAIEALEDKTDAEKAQLLSTVQAEIDKIKALTPDSPESTLLGIPASYWLSLKQIDTPELSRNLTIPMLIMQGTADFQVSSEVDYAGWQEVLSEKETVTFRLYEGLNHLFMPTNGKNDTSEYSIKSSVDEQVTADIAAWIHAH